MILAVINNNSVGRGGHIRRNRAPAFQWGSPPFPIKAFRFHCRTIGSEGFHLNVKMLHGIQYQREELRIRTVCYSAVIEERRIRVRTLCCGERKD